MSGSTFSVDMLTETTGKRLAAALEAEADAAGRIANKLGAYDLPQSWPEYQAHIRQGRAKQISPVGTKLQVDKESGVSTTIHGAITAAAVVEDTFISAVGHSGTAAYEFVYDGSTWHHNDDEVELANYGLSYTGTPAEDDMIVVHVQASKIDFDVVAIDYDVPVNDAIGHTVSLWTSDLLLYNSIPFCSPQALRAIDATEFPSGIAENTTCVITLDHGCYNGTTTEDGIYSFVAPVAIPAGAKIRHTTMGGWLSSGYGTSHITGGKFIIYDEDYNILAQNIATTLESSFPAGATDLGTATASNPTYQVTDHMNFTQRNAYGSNRNAHSANRKYLRSDAAGAASGQIASWWSASDEFDMPVKSTLPGFLHGLDPAFRNIIQTVRKRTALCIADGYGYEDTEETIFFPSMTELGFGKNNNQFETATKADGTVATELAWDMYIGASNADRIKTHNGTARYYWLRSPYPSSASYERYVSTSGALYDYSASSARGVSAGLTIG